MENGSEGAQVRSQGNWLGGYYVIDLKEGHSMWDRTENYLGGKVIKTSSLVLRNERVMGDRFPAWAPRWF